MKKLILLFLIGLLIPTYSWTQSLIQGKINTKIIEGLLYVLDQKKSFPNDILIIRTTESKKFYIVINFNDPIVEVKEVTPPDLTAIMDKMVQINKDSIYDILWVKKKKYQSIILTDNEIPFNKLSARFPDDKIDALQSDIKNLKDQAYFEEVKQKYSNLKIIRSQSFDEALSQAFKDSNVISVPINYPQQAREHGTQGQVKIGYVFTTNGDVQDLYVFQGLGDGCTESVISSTMELSKKLKERNYYNSENIFFEITVNFTLN